MVEVVAYRFGPHRLEPATHRLLAEGRLLRLGGRAFDLLVALVERRDRTVSKHELLDLVWPRLVVEEGNLQVQVAALRKLLGHSAVATVPGRGYRFVLPVIVEGTVHDAIPDGVPPAAPPALLGREADLAGLLALVAGSRLVTLAGSGGIGKTRLARSALAAWPQGGAWVELAPLTNVTDAAASVAAAAARALGVLADERALDAVVAALATEARLLVLDNAEHVLAGVVALANAVQAHAPQARLLVTSQEVLRLPQEQVLRLAPLALPAAPGLDAALASGAVALFAARARAADRRFALRADNVEAVVDICRRVDGIPLAIELAAVRVPLLGVGGVRARLDDCFRVLTVGARDAPPRQQTLRAALAWSHGLLDDPAQRVLRRLGVFVGSFALDVAQDVAADDTLDTWAVLDQLGTLVDKSLVLADAAEPPRYRLLEITRQFALERLLEAGEGNEHWRRHAIATAAAIDRARINATGLDLWTALAAEVDNARAALHWAAAHADVPVGVRLATSASFAFSAANLNAEFLALAGPWLEHVEHGGAAPAEAAALLRRVAASGKNGGHAVALRAALQAIDMLRAGTGNARELHEVLVIAVAIGSRRGDALPYEDLLAEARQLQRPDWPLPPLANWQWAHERWLMRAGRHGDALVSALAMAEMVREHAAVGAPQIALFNAAGHELALGRVDEAEVRARAAIAALEPVTAQRSAAGYGWSVVAACEARRGAWRSAIASCRRARPSLEIEGDEAQLLPTLAACAVGLGRAEAGGRILGHLDAARALVGSELLPAEAEQRQRLLKALGDALDAGMVEYTLADGALLSRAEAFSIGFGRE